MGNTDDGVRARGNRRIPVKGAAARVLPKEKRRAHLSLVDNVEVGEPIVAEAQKQQETRLQRIDAGQTLFEQEPARKRAPRKPKRIAPVRRTFTYKGRCNPVALGVAELIQARHGGYIQKVNATTVIVTNHPPERAVLRAPRLPERR